MKGKFVLSRLSRAVRALADERGSDLKHRMKEALKGFRRRDFIWQYLLQSFDIRRVGGTTLVAFDVE
jgi:hypothetical protein